MKENSCSAEVKEKSLMTPQQVRDIMVECFLEAQEETFKRTYRKLQIEKNPESLYRSVETAVRLAFREVMGDFDNPTKQKLVEVLQVLAAKASSWGTPTDIVKTNRDKMIALVQSIKD